MSDDTQVLDAPVNDGTAIPGEAAPAPSPDVETRARAQGWVDKDEFRGDPTKWRDANEFVRRGEEELPILRERSRTLERRLADVERTYEQKLQRLEGMSVAALQRQRAEIVRSYEAAKRDAVQTGDQSRYDQLEQDKWKAVEHFDESVSRQIEPRQPQGQQPGQGQQPQKPLSPQEQQMLDTWADANAWVRRDTEMRAVATAHLDAVQAKHPGMSLQESLAEVAKYVRRRYPEKFGTPSNEPAMVEGGGRMAASPRASYASRLTSEERKIGERYVKEGLFKTLDAYAKELHEGN